MNRRMISIRKVLFTAIILVLVLSVSVYAAETDTKSIDNLVKFMLDWVQKIGIVAAIVGGIEWAFAFSGDNAEGKNRALKHLAAGFMVAGIAASPTLFGFMS